MQTLLAFNLIQVEIVPKRKLQKPPKTVLATYFIDIVCLGRTTINVNRNKKKTLGVMGIL